MSTVRHRTHLHLLRGFEVSFDEEPVQGGQQARSAQVVHGLEFVFVLHYFSGGGGRGR